MRADKLHATLVFVGEIDESILQELRRATHAVHADGFEICFDLADYWEHNHIVFAAPVNIPVQLQNLVRNLENSLAHCNVRFDHREYKPHITLLRNARWNNTTFPAMQKVCWQVGEFVLVQSVQQEYRVLERYSLS